MNYQHIYHAGNFADVFKHTLLILLLQDLQRKEKGFCYIEGYAGEGVYDLRSPPAQKSGEFQRGIGRLWQRRDTLPPELLPFIQRIKSLNNDTLRYYPGSPEIARFLLRPQDRMILGEIQTESGKQLRQLYGEDKRIQVRIGDAAAILRALLPPPLTRGIVLLDPPFERVEEFDHQLTLLQTAYRLWQNGIFALWYPIKDLPPVARFHRRLQESGFVKLLAIELLLYPPDNPHYLNGCGLIVVNPPWRFAEQAERLVSQLVALVGQTSASRGQVRWLIAEKS